MANCNGCEFCKPCEDPVIGDFYCNYDPREVETYRRKDINSIDCKRERDFRNENGSEYTLQKPEITPQSKQKVARKIQDSVPPKTPLIDYSYIEDPELRSQAQKLAKMQEELYDKIIKKNRDCKIEKFFSTELETMSHLQDRFMTGQLKINNDIDVTDYTGWNNKTFGKKNAIPQCLSPPPVLLGYLLGRYVAIQQQRPEPAD